MDIIKFNDYEKGDEIPGLSVDGIYHHDLVRYSGASGDFNRIHTDPEYALAAGLENGSIVHGMFVMGLMGRMVSNWVVPTQLKSYGVKFTGMVMPKEDLVFTGKIKRKAEKDGEKLLTVSLIAANKEGEKKVAGEIVVLAE